MNPDVLAVLPVHWFMLEITVVSLPAFIGGMFYVFNNPEVCKDIKIYPCVLYHDDVITLPYLTYGEKLPDFPPSSSALPEYRKECGESVLPRSSEEPQGYQQQTV